MKHIEVMVSVYYRGKGWTDEKTGIFFEPMAGTPRVYRVKGDADLSGIKDAIRQNLLMLVSGDLEAAVANKEVEIVEKEVKEEQTEVVTSEEEVEEKEETPSKKTHVVFEGRDLDLEKLEKSTLVELKKFAKEEGIKHKAKITRKELMKTIIEQFEG